MIAASARQLGGVTNCFVGVGLPNIVCNLAQRTVAPDAAARLRVGRVRRPARTAPALDRRPHAGDGLHRDHQHVRAVRVLPAGRADRRRVPRRRADRSLRQPQHHGDRRLRHPKVRLPGLRRRVRDRDPREADARDHAAGAALVRGHARLPHLARGTAATLPTTPRAAGTAAVPPASSPTWAPTASTRPRGR